MGELQKHSRARPTVGEHVSSLHLFTNILLAKANHMAKSEVKEQRNVHPADLKAIAMASA